MSFAYPWVLGLLLALPLFYLWWSRLEKKRQALAFPSAALLAGHEHPQATLLFVLPLLLRLLLLASLILAAARPQWREESGKRSAEGLDIVLAIDTSNSMMAMDFELEGERKNRLEVVKSVVESFVDKRRDDRIGLVIFGSEAYTQAPLTMDHNVLQQFLKPVAIGMAGPETAIGDALATAVKRLKEVPAPSKIIILLTDGSNTAGQIDPREAARLAQSLGVKVYTIGVGSNEAVPFPVRGFWGMEYRPQVIKMDEALMQDIATQTGGQFFRASSTEALRAVYETIDRLEKTKQEWDDPRGFREASWPFLALALVFFLAEIGWSLSPWRFLREEKL